MSTFLIDSLETKRLVALVKARSELNKPTVTATVKFSPIAAHCLDEFVKTHAFTDREELLTYWIECLSEGIMHPDHWQRPMIEKAFRDGTIEAARQRLPLDEFGQYVPEEFRTQKATT